MDKKEFVNMKEAAEILGVNPQTMNKIIHAEGFKYTRLGRKILINKSKMLEYMENHKIIRYWDILKDVTWFIIKNNILYKQKFDI